jgi:hypothetical protein
VLYLESDHAAVYEHASRTWWNDLTPSLVLAWAILVESKLPCQRCDGTRTIPNACRPGVGTLCSACSGTGRTHVARLLDATTDETARAALDVYADELQAAGDERGLLLAHALAHALAGQPHPGAISWLQQFTGVSAGEWQEMKQNFLGEPHPGAVPQGVPNEGD